MALRDELEQLDDERSRDERAPLFRVGNAEIEVSFVVKREAGAEGKVELQVVTVGGTEKWSQEQVQNIKLNLLTTPTRKDQSAPEEPSKALDKSQ